MIESFFILHTLSCNFVAAGISIVVAVDCSSFTLAVFFILIDLWLATRVLHQWHGTRGGSWSVGALPCHHQVWGRGQYNTQTYSPFIDSFLPYSSCVSLLAFKFYNVKIFGLCYTEPRWQGQHRTHWVLPTGRIPLQIFPIP